MTEAVTIQPASAYHHFADSVRHFADRDLEAAHASALLAQQLAPDEALYADAARFVEKVREQGGQALYAEPDAFSAFIGGGSNLPLYDNTRSLLIKRLRALAPTTLLDIGTGEGTIIVPVVNALDDKPHLTFCEPSVALLERATDFAWDYGLEPEGYPLPVEVMLEAREDCWDVAIATWSLQNLPRSKRAPVLRKLAGQVGRLFIAEFDDGSGDFENPLDPERIRHVHDRYRLGLQEYPGEEGRRVRRDFLLPVLYGYFLREGRRSTYEQPIARWEKELREAGFQQVSRTLIYSYWWADAYLLEAVGGTAGKQENGRELREMKEIGEMDGRGTEGT